MKSTTNSNTNQETTSDTFSVPLPIANATTYQFIDAIKPGTVLTQVIDNNTLNITNNSNKIIPFIMTLYQTKKYNDAFYFAHSESINEAKTAFKIYNNHYNLNSSSNFYGHLIIINDINKFNELANKTSPGYATKNGSWSHDATWSVLSYYYEDENDFIMIDKSKVNAAIKNVPKQTRSWACGPNSSLRSVYLLGLSWSHGYDSWVNGCPKRICKKTTVSKGATTYKTGWGLTALGMIFAPVTMGASLIPGAATMVTGAGIAVTGSAISSDVGPTVTMLANYLSKKIKSSKYTAWRKNYEYSCDYEKDIKKDIRLGYPRIVLIVSGSFSMHYVNVIGYNDDYFVLMDTDKAVGHMKRSNLRKWLDYDTASLILDARYNTVEFGKI